MDEDVGGLEGMKARGEGCLKEEACGWKGEGDQHRRGKHSLNPYIPTGCL